MKKNSQFNQSALKSVQSLSMFKLLPNETAPVYHDATALPIFLQNNLKSDHRVIKQFEGEDAILKAFYFSLMKLTFEIEIEEQNYQSIVKQILVSQQEFGVGQLQDKSLSDGQYRKFLLQFMQIIENQQIPCFEETIQWYPIIDQILLKMFRRLVPVTLKLKDNTDHFIAKRILEFLSQKFKINLQIISGCFKFVEADIFVYIETLKKIYVVFVDQLAFIQQVTEKNSSEAMGESVKGILNSASPRCSFEQEGNIKSVDSLSSGSSKRQSRAFNTVINMLDSKNSAFNNSDMAVSIKCRNSFENKKEIFMKKPESDKIKQKQKQLVENYYGSQSKLANQISSFSTIKGQRSANSSYSSFLLDIKQPEIRKSIHSELEQQRKLPSNLEGQEIRTFKNQQTCIELASNPKEILNNFTSIKLNSSKSAEKFDFKKIRSPKAAKVQQPSRQLSQSSNNNNKNSKLGLFSKMQPKGSLSGQPKQEVIPSQMNKSYEKFTDSIVLQCLDQQYKEKIKAIKQKYRLYRSNCKKII